MSGEWTPPELLSTLHFIKKAVSLSPERQITYFLKVHELARIHPQGFPGVTARHPLQRGEFR